MADVAPAYTQLETLYGHTHKILWTPLTSANAKGTPIEMSGSADRSVHVFGTFDSATVVIEGSNDYDPANPSAATWATLHDQAAVAISSNAAYIRSISEITAAIRPNSSGGGGSQSVSVAMVVRRPL